MSVACHIKKLPQVIIRLAINVMLAQTNCVSAGVPTWMKKYKFKY